MRHFVFYHGFGFNHHFWDNIAPYFSQEHCTYIDAGYFSSPSEPLQELGQPVIAIGHSLGVMKLLTSGKKFDYILSLNGFVNFCGNDRALSQKRHRELKLLTQHFIENPFNTLKNFYNRCHVPSFMQHIKREHINVQRMLADLELLTTQVSPPPPTTPMLVISAENDTVVPPLLVHDNFDRYPHITVEFIQHGAHGIGFLHPYDIYKRIKDFIHDIPA